MKIGVRELKAKLSEYLDRAAAGQVVTITSRGRAIAQLVPIAGVALERGLEEGWLLRETDSPPWPVTPWKPRAGRPSTLDALHEDRGE